MRLTAMIPLLVLATAISAQIPQDVTEFQLSNGIPVITRTIDNNEIEGVSLFIIGGSRALTESTQGLESFALECAMMGSEEYPGPLWRELMDSTQAEWTTNFNYDFSRYHLKCIRTDLPLLLTAFGDCLLEPELDPEAVEQVRVRTIQDLQEKYTDPDKWIWNVANDVFMPGHVYRNLPDGTPETVSSFTESDIRGMLERRIRAGNLLIVHAGPTPPEQLREILENAFGSIPAGGEEFPPVDDFVVSADTLELQPRDVETAYAVVKFNAPPQGDPDLLPFRLAMAVLSDRLWQVLRTENALTYATWAGATTYRKNWGYMYVSTPRPVEACSLMAGVLRDMIANPVDEDLVRGTVEKQLTMLAINAATKSGQCWLMGSYQICTGDWRNAFTEAQYASGLTSRDISDVLRRWVVRGAWGIIADTASIQPDRFEPFPLR